MNQVQIIGRLTKDVELSYTSQSQTAKTLCTVAVNRLGKKDEADFISVKVFGNTAEALSKYCKKGSLIGVVGRIETSQYKNNEGQTIYRTDVVANNIDFLSWEHTTGANKKENQEEGNNFAAIDSEFPF